MVIEKIKSWRGFLYRKLAGLEEKGIQLPGFSIQSFSRMIEFPEVKNLTEVNVTYPLLEPFAYTNIKWNPEIRELEYLVLEPQLDEEERKILKRISDALIELVEIGLTSMRETSKAISYLEKQISKIVVELGLKITPNQYVKLMYYIYRNFIGYNEIESLLQDPNIEDISCDGIETPIYIIHRKYGSLKTNISFKNLEDLREFVIKLAERCGRYVSYAEPILDGTLPDGSRVSATLAGDVATRGPTFTLRKFGENPFSPIDQIELGTANPEILAYFWYLVEHGISVLIVGGVSTGKTSFLNTISMFIPSEAKIVSIEDTREIRIPHQHWIAGLARSGFGLPTPTGEKYGEVSLFDLLKESFRQNPDYVIVGEVRGSETYVMFQGISSGHPSISTFHAGSVDTVIKRLISPPIELSPTLIESLDVVAVMIHAREKEKSARRVKEVVEIVSVDPKTEEVKTNTVYRWDPITDTYEKISESVKLEKIATARGATLEDALQDVERRKKVLVWLMKKGVKDYLEVAKFVNMYYKEQKKLFEMMGEEYIPITVEKKIEVEIKTVAAKPVAVPIAAKIGETVEKQRRKIPRKTPILELLGFKTIKEK